MESLQEILALGIVVVIAGLYWRRRRRKAKGSCGDCATPGPLPRENTLRFYRRTGPGSADTPKK